MLSGERIHQWVGARYRRDRMGRLEKQKVLVRSLMRALDDDAHRLR